MRAVNATLPSILSRRISLLCGILLIIIVQFVVAPASLLEYDEPLFASALESYQPLERHHPPPPGYPLLIGLGQTLNYFIGDPFTAMVWLSGVASVLGFLMLALSGELLTGRTALSVSGALMFYLSPAMLVHSTLPVSDATGLALLSTAFYLSIRLVAAPDTKHCLLFALTASAAIGCRPQLSIIVVPLLLLTLGLLRNVRSTAIVLATFGLLCVGWLIPLAFATNGFKGLLAFEVGQADYLAAHDAEISRNGWTPVGLLFRFVAHAWGPKWLSIFVLAAAIAGFVQLLRQRKRASIPFVVAGSCYLAFALAFMDPADGVRYSLPFTMVIALLAGSFVAIAAKTPMRSFLAFLLLADFAIASGFYVSSMIKARRSGLSPPVAAAQEARRTLPASAVVLYERPLLPHAERLLVRFRPMPVEKGLAAYADTDVPLWIYGHGRSSREGAKNWTWPDSDAYGKLTRNHYRVVSLAPLPAEERFRVLSGVYPIERSVSAGSWRWLSPEAQVRLPDLRAAGVELRLRLHPDAPWESNRTTFFLNGVEAGQLVVRRDRAAQILLPLPAGSVVLRIRSDRSFVPAALAGTRNRDPRRLAVMLTGVNQRRDDVPTVAAPRDRPGVVVP